MSATQQRRVTSFPPEKYFGMVKAYALIYEVSDSAITSQAIKEFMDNLPQHEREKIQSVAEKMTTVSKNNY